VILQVAKMSLLVLEHAINTWESDVKRIVTRGTVDAILTLSEGLWELELLGHTHEPLPSSEKDDKSRVMIDIELSRFLIDNREPTIAGPQRYAPPHEVSRAVYIDACCLSSILHSITKRDDLRDVLPDKLPLLKGAHGRMHPQARISSF
jgi:hypothetical protein